MKAKKKQQLPCPIAMAYVSYMTTQYNIRAADTGRICVNIIITIVWWDVFPFAMMNINNNERKKNETNDDEFI